jgi:uncharacterized radical SAM superfamily Fe-S cluster-containing enzyme
MDAELLAATTSLCGTCKRLVDARVVERAGAVWLEKTCPEHGPQEALVASSAAWYRDCLSFVAEPTPPKRALKEVAAGCPYDCGPCAAHQQKVFLPVIPVTSACNLDCPICYTVNKNDDPLTMSREHFGRILARLAADHEELDIVNITGGEPTLHPELPELVAMARAAGIRRVTISTNGLKLLDEGLVARLAAAGARVILSLDTLRPEVDRAMLGAVTVAAKLRVLDLLEAHGVVTTILPAVGAGYNDADVPALLELVLSRPHVSSLELHPLTFTGQGGVGFDRRARVTTPDLLRRIEETTDGRIAPRDFVPSPLAHPTCYSICYLLMLDGGGYVPLARLASRATLFDLLRDSLYLEPRERVEALFGDLIDELWADPDRLPGSERVLATLKRMLGEMFPSGGARSSEARQRVAERAFKAIYVHAHMDEETFDTARVRRCPVGVPEADGSNTPTCSYNVVYRERDARFADPAMLTRMEERRPRARLPVVQ